MTETQLRCIMAAILAAPREPIVPAVAKQIAGDVNLLCAAVEATRQVKT
jgi:hypothetical protein